MKLLTQYGVVYDSGNLSAISSLDPAEAVKHANQYDGTPFEFRPDSSQFATHYAVAARAAKGEWIASGVYKCAEDAVHATVIIEIAMPNTYEFSIYPVRVIADVL
jgi:hypothetical protein